MAWAKVDDDAPLSRKFFRAGVAAFGLDVAAWCYCNREGTDGYVPTRDLPIVFPGLSLSRAVALAVKLVEVGRWSADGEGYRIHDFHEYQFSAEQIADRRRKRAEAGRIGGLRSGATRRSNTPSKDEAGASTAAKQTSNPVPVPVPVPVPDRTEPQKHRSRGVVLLDDRLIEELGQDAAYRGVDVPREVAKFDRWLSTPRGRGKQRSYQRFVGWLNRAEPTGSNGVPSRREINDPWKGKTEAREVKL